jgi:hypothetical protein
MERPGRPFGLSLAIVFSILVFSIFPVVQIVFFLSVQHQFQQIEFLTGGGAVGGSLSGDVDPGLIILVVAGLIFFVIAGLTWRGKSPVMRFVFVAAVLAMTLLILVLTFTALSGDGSLEQGLDSGGSFIDSLLGARLAMSLLVALYVIWYVNRGPARAFFRGYYLPDPDAAQPVADSD